MWIIAARAGADFVKVLLSFGFNFQGNLEWFVVVYQGVADS